MLHLRMRKSLSLVILVLLPLLVDAQVYNRDKDFKRFHFGITLGLSYPTFKLVHDEEFLYHDTILVVESPRGTGLNIGIISNMRLGDHFDLRFIPSLGFSEKKLLYHLIGDSTVKQTIESTNMEFPLTLKFKSDRVNNFRMYILGGFKYSLDLASNAEARNASDIVLISQSDILAEFGVGFSIDFPMFKFSPEIKWSYGIFNIHSKNPNLIYSEVIDRLLTRTVLISFHFEG